MKIINELNRIQNELKAPKGQRNTFANFNYRNCEDILEAVKPLLKGLTITISDEIINVGDRYYVKATATISSETENFSTTAFARESLEKKGMDSAQITGATSSYARKYALNGLFAIDDTKDADSTDNTKKEEPVKTNAECEHLKTSDHQVVKEGKNKDRWFKVCEICKTDGKKTFVGWTVAPNPEGLVTNENGSQSWGNTEYGEPH